MKNKKANSAKYRESHREQLKMASRDYYQRNKEKISIKNKERYEKCPEKFAEKNRRWKSKNINRRRELYKIRIEIDPLYKLDHRIRNLIKECLKRRHHHKTSKTVDILGCSIEEFKYYIEDKFEDWMTWENHGKYNTEKRTWQLDHIIPISTARDEEELIKLCHYTNYQPLDSMKNMKKWNRKEKNKGYMGSYHYNNPETSGLLDEAKAVIDYRTRND